MFQPLPRHRSREYETIFIVRPDQPSEAVEQLAGRVTGVIDRLQGKLLKAENWGKRRLAYPVAKQVKGTYVYLRYLGYSDLVHELERNLRMMEPVIKHLTVKIEEDVNPDARPVAEGDISFAPAFEDEPDPPTPSEELQAAAARAEEGDEGRRRPRRAEAPATEPKEDEGGEDGSDDEDDEE